jgi:hypothetical protein
MDSSTWDKKFGSLLITDCTVLLTILTAATKKTIQRGRNIIGGSDLRPEHWAAQRSRQVKAFLLQEVGPSGAAPVLGDGGAGPPTEAVKPKAMRYQM